MGLILDGSYRVGEARFSFTDEVAPSVTVHSRAIVEALRKVYGAKWLAGEPRGGRAGRLVAGRRAG